jgi:acyl carrier protein
MEAARIEQQVYAGLARLCGGHPIRPDTDIVVELGLDSLQVMEMLMEIEDALDVSIPVNILAEVRTAGELARAVQALLEG